MILESGMRWLMNLVASTLFSTIAKQTTLKLSNLKHQILSSHTSCGLRIRAWLSWGFWLQVLYKVVVRVFLRSVILSEAWLGLVLIPKPTPMLVGKIQFFVGRWTKASAHYWLLARNFPQFLVMWVSQQGH